jgi:hypothetical protein
MTRRYLLVLTLVLVVIAFCQAVLAADQSATRGVFVDGSGGRHSWSINDSHALVWDDQPYIPAGVVFTSSYLSSPTDADWQSDTAALQSIKTAGITDVLVRGTGPATTYAAAGWQKLIDYLEAEKFTYGIELDGGPATLAAGIVVSPRRYKMSKITQSGQLDLNIPRAQGGFFVTVDPSSGAALDSGYIKVADGKASIKVTVKEGDTPALLVFPVKDIATGRGALPDIWQDGGEYRDKLIDFFKGIKFGPGFRFFYAPFAGGVAPAGEMANAIPNSQSFRMGLEGWLSIKYQNVENLTKAWALKSPDDLPFDRAARLVPLWWDAKGLSLAFDRENGSFIEIDVPNSAMWKDILDYRNSSIQASMNAAADALKRSADVPVVFAEDAYQGIYANPRDAGGFDGLGAQVATDSDQDTTTAGQTYALTLEAGKMMWFVGVTNPGADASDTSRALARLKDMGAKGFFTRGPNGAASTGAVADFKKLLDSSAADYSPGVLFYPQSALSGAHVKKLDQKTWWLPTTRPGQLVQFGENIFGYSLSGDMRYPSEASASGDGVALWCNKGAQNGTIRLKGQQFSVSQASQSAAQLSPKKDLLTLTLSEIPLVIYGLPTDQLFPVELAQSQIDTLQDLVTAASQASQNVSGYGPIIEQARQQLKDFNPLLAYQSASTKLQSLASDFSPWVWMEGEKVKDHNFDGVEAMQGCSGGQYLKLTSSDDAPLRSYSATYPFTVPAEGSYDIWLAATPPGKGGSDLLYTLDGTNWQQVIPSDVSAPYVGSFAWFKAGNIALTKGSHAISFVLAARTSTDTPYNAAIDVVLLTKQAFVPNGTVKPAYSEAPKKTKHRGGL